MSDPCSAPPPRLPRDPYTIQPLRIVTASDVRSVDEAVRLSLLDFDPSCVAGVEPAEWALVCKGPGCRSVTLMCSRHLADLREIWAVIERLGAGCHYARRCCRFVAARFDDAVDVVPLRGGS